MLTHADRQRLAESILATHLPAPASLSPASLSPASRVPQHGSRASGPTRTRLPLPPDACRATRDPDRTLEPLHVVLPLRTVSGGKARLGEALDAEEREELVLGLLLHTLSVLATWSRCERIHLVSPDPVLAARHRAGGC